MIEAKKELIKKGLLNLGVRTGDVMKMSYKIRKFQPKDAKAVSRLIYKSFRWFHEDKLPWYKKGISSSELRKKARLKNASSYVAEEGAKIIGYIHGAVSPCGLATLELVAVDVSCFAKGVGTGLMQKFLNFCTKKGARKVYTCVSASNTRALIYYIKHGFRPEGYSRDHFKEGEDEIMLGKFFNKQVMEK